VAAEHRETRHGRRATMSCSTDGASVGQLARPGMLEAMGPSGLSGVTGSQRARWCRRLWGGRERRPNFDTLLESETLTRVERCIYI
jgi:hypothetical protein